VERILVIGCAGSGKSAFARRLSAVTGLTHIERDALGPEGMASTLGAIERAVAGTDWIFDGYPYYADHLVLARADTLVIFDLPKRLVMRQVLLRRRGSS
jgi:adenylate kinase family enzyme